MKLISVISAINKIIVITLNLTCIYFSHRPRPEQGGLLSHEYSCAAKDDLRCTGEHIGNVITHGSNCCVME